MGRAVAVRTDYTAGEVRLLANRAKDAAQARWLPAIAAVLEGASRTDSATIGGMDRQTLGSMTRDRVVSSTFAWGTALTARFELKREACDGHTSGDQFFTPNDILSIALRDWAAVGHSLSGLVSQLR